MIGEILIGGGFFAVTLGVASWFFTMSKGDELSNKLKGLQFLKEQYYTDVECAFLNKFSRDLGVDVDYELDVAAQKSRVSFRKRLEEELIERTFEKPEVPAEE